MQNISAALNIEVRQADDKAQNGSVTDQHAKTERIYFNIEGKVCCKSLDDHHIIIIIQFF